MTIKGYECPWCGEQWIGMLIDNYLVLNTQIYCPNGCHYWYWNHFYPYSH
jgi:hypothetical protein